MNRLLHMAGDMISPFWVPKSSPSQMPSTPMEINFSPAAMANRSHFSSSASTHASPVAVSMSNFSRPTICCINPQSVTSISPTTKYSAPNLAMYSAASS